MGTWRSSAPQLSVQIRLPLDFHEAVVQWIGHGPAKTVIQVRLLVASNFDLLFVMSDITLVVDIIVEYQNAILLIQRKKDPFK